MRVEIIASPLRYRLSGFDYVRGRKSVVRSNCCHATESEVVEEPKEKREKKRRVEESAGGLLGNEAFVLGALPTPLLLEKHITVLGQGEK